MCIPLYNRGENITKLIFNLNDINKLLVKEKKEFNIKIVIGDYNSTDVDFNDILKK